MPNSAPTDSGLLSVVLPAFNEEEMAPRAADVISALLEQAQIPHELIFVDDGSRDRTWARIQEKSRALPQVRGVRFSRNFGKEAAIFAGLAQARGACCVVLDCDLQHPPEKIAAGELFRHKSAAPERIPLSGAAPQTDPFGRFGGPAGPPSEIRIQRHVRWIRKPCAARFPCAFPRPR